MHWSSALRGGWAWMGAVDLALKGGYAVVVAAKTWSLPGAALDGVDPNSPESTVDNVAHDIVKAGGRAHAVTADVRDENSVRSMVKEAVQANWTCWCTSALLLSNPRFRLTNGNNSSGALWWARFKDTPRVHAEGLYSTISFALPRLAEHARVAVVRPPIYSRFIHAEQDNLRDGSVRDVLGLAQDWKREASEQAITSLWTATAIDSAATRHNDPTGETRKAYTYLCSVRSPDILAIQTIFSDAVLAILSAPPERLNGLLILRDVAGVKDFS